MPSISTKVERVCEFCGKTFEIGHRSKNRPNKYCSLDCRVKTKSTFRDFVCKQCGTSFGRSGYRYRRTQGDPYCSRHCARTHCVPTIDRFFEHVGGKQPNGCILWDGILNKRGYGVLSRGGNGQKAQIASRVSYELFRGPIPKGLYVCHDCPGGDNPACINPYHLWLGTADQNNKDKVAKGREPRGEQRPNSKLTDEKVRYIRRRHDEGATNKELAKETDTHPTIVSMVLNGHIWDHVT